MQVLQIVVNIFSVFYLCGLCLGVQATETCSCSGVNCRCCVNINSNTGCLDVTYNPSDLSLSLVLLANDQTVYSTKLDSTNFPICAPFIPPACLAFNRLHIGLDGAQICSQVLIGRLPIAKIPCLNFAGGLFSVTPNH